MITPTCITYIISKTLRYTIHFKVAIYSKPYRGWMAGEVIPSDSSIKNNEYNFETCMKIRDFYLFCMLKKKSYLKKKTQTHAINLKYCVLKNASGWVETF